MKTQAGLFIDFDGTLADSLPVMKKVYLTFLAVHNIEGKLHNFSDVNGPPLIEVIKFIKDKYQLKHSITKLHENYISLIEQHHHEVYPATGAEKVLAKAVSLDWKIVIVTSNNKNVVNDWLIKHRLERYIDKVIGDDDVNQGKPHPDPYLKGILISNCRPENSFAVEDSLIGATAAMAAGLKTYCLVGDKNPTDLKRVNSVKWINKFNDLLDII